MVINSNNLWQSNPVHEYLLAGCPDADVCDRVLKEMECFSAEYGEKMAIKSKPRISIASFLASEGMESTIIKWMQRICGAQQSFVVDLNNYSGLAPHTIYLRIQNPQPFQELARQLKTVDDFIRASDYPPARLNGNPYLSIAGKLNERVYNKAMADYAQKTFHASFMMDELVLLRRQHQFDACKIIQVFRLMPADSSVFSGLA